MGKGETMIRFACSSCGRLISVDEKYSGKKGKCPKCGNVVVVPERSTIIEFSCESCGHKIRVPDNYGGKKGNCPKCKNPVAVPSRKKVPAEDVKTTTITCSMCSQAIEVPEDSSEVFTECPACGSYVEVSSGGVPGVFDASIPSRTDEDLHQKSAEAYEEPAGVDRRLIVMISAVAVIAVVGLVLLVVTLRPSQPQKEAAGIGEALTQHELDQVQTFAEKYIGLLEKGGIDEARQSLAPGLAEDANRPQVERLSQQIGRSTIIEIDCTRREQRPEGDQVLLWYVLRCEDRSTQTVIVSVLPMEQELTIDGIAARDSFGRTVSIGAKSFGELSRMGATAAIERRRPSLGRFFLAFIVRFTIQTFLLACCLWVGTRVIGVGGTFVAILGIAAISSLTGMIPMLAISLAFLAGMSPLLGPVVGHVASWAPLISVLVMFVLICKWTDAAFFPDAVGIVLVAFIVVLVANMLLQTHDLFSR